MSTRCATCPIPRTWAAKRAKYSVKAFVVQGRSYSYFDARKELLKALESYGPGTLIHPWHGEIKVCVDRYSMREYGERRSAAGRYYVLRGWQP